MLLFSAPQSLFPKPSMLDMVQTQSACLQAEPGGCLSIFTGLHLSICIQWCPAGSRLVLHGWVQKSGHSLVSTLPSFVHHTGHFTSFLEQHLYLWLETAVWTQKSIRGSWKWQRGNFSSFPSKVVFQHHCSSLKGPMNRKKNIRLLCPVLAVWCYFSLFRGEKRSSQVNLIFFGIVHSVHSSATHTHLVRLP